MEPSVLSNTLHPISNAKEPQDLTGPQNKYRDLISGLPKTLSWKDFDYHYQYQGFWYNMGFLPGILSAQERFQAKPTDIILCSAPKTGTTWLKALALAILTRTHFGDSSNPLLTKLPHDCVGMLELNDVPDPVVPLFGTHIPYNSLPKSIIENGCKIIYIWRDAKDAFVSMWHFLRKLKMKDSEPISAEEAFDLFCQGNSNCGPYWDHVLGFWNASLEHPNKVLFLKYEHMKKDTAFFIKKMAEFLSQPFTSEEESEGVVERVIDLCSFEKLSNLDVNKNGMHNMGPSMKFGNNVFFRKGKVGDWENYLTPDMGKRLDQIMEEKFKGAGLALD